MERFPALGAVSRRAGSVLVAASVLIGACSSSEPVVATVSEDDVVLAYVDVGVDADVAECFVGLGQRQFELEVLLPGAALEADRPLVDEVLMNCENAVAMLGAEELPTPQALRSGPFNIGDDAELDRLWVECDRGDGSGCDELWEESPVGSVYEWFGVTCGNRPEILNCTEELGDGSEELGDDPDAR
jgi:hypothetical protein